MEIWRLGWQRRGSRLGSSTPHVHLQTLKSMLGGRGFEPWATSLGMWPYRFCVSVLNLYRPMSSPISQPLLAVAVTLGNMEALAEAPVEGDGSRPPDHGGFSSACQGRAGSDSMLVKHVQEPQAIDNLRAQRPEGDGWWVVDGGWRLGFAAFVTSNIQPPLFRCVVSILCLVSNGPQIVSDCTLQLASQWPVTTTTYQVPGPRVPYSPLTSCMKSAGLLGPGILGGGRTGSWKL